MDAREKGIISRLLNRIHMSWEPEGNNMYVVYSQFGTQPAYHVQGVSGIIWLVLTMCRKQ